MIGPLRGKSLGWNLAWNNRRVSKEIIIHELNKFVWGKMFLSTYGMLIIIYLGVQELSTLFLVKCKIQHFREEISDSLV